MPALVNYPLKFNFDCHGCGECVGGEGLPKVLVEAMTKSCPVVATRVGSVPFMIEDGVNGFLVEPGRAEDIAEAVERLIDEPQVRQRIVRAGLQYAASNNYSQQVELVGRSLRKALIPKFGECCDEKKQT